MNLPNKLTISRIAITFVFLAALLSGVPYGKTIALFLFLVASLTDLLDGVIARKRNLITDFGTLMDPVADKVLISAAFIAFVQLPETRIPAWIAVVIVTREFVITGLRLGLPFSVTLHVLMYVTVARTAFTGVLHLRDHKELLLNGV